MSRFGRDWGRVSGAGDGVLGAGDGAGHTLSWSGTLNLSASLALPLLDRNLFSLGL